MKIMKFAHRCCCSSTVQRHGSQATILTHHKEFLDLVANDESRHHEDGKITLSLRDNIAFIDINNPRKKNSFTGQMMIQLGEIIDELCMNAENYSTTPCVVMKAKNCDTFSSGASFDLVKEKINSPERGVLMAEFMTDCLNSLRESPFISLCFINGPALGGGAELTTFSDFRIITDSPRSRIQFVHALLGASPGWGGARYCTH